MDIRTEREKIISALTAARMEKGLSQEALARMIGTQRSNICRIESPEDQLCAWERSCSLAFCTGRGRTASVFTAFI